MSASLARSIRALALALAALAAAGSPLPAQRRTSGGRLSPEQAAYDVRHYALSLRVDVEARAIAGTLEARVRLLQPLKTLVLDLDAALTVTGVEELRPDGDVMLAYVHEDLQVRVALGAERPAGSTLTVRVHYDGRPMRARRPPWVGGLTWSETPSGAPWVATSCQMQGADLWWPCKDHPSDEPDEGMTIRFRVPRPLVAASNGRLEEVVEHDDGTRTFCWRVSTPINPYCVALNLAPYVVLEGRYESVTGELVPLQFFALPENAGKARLFLAEVQDHLRFLEESFGPYPFRADKYGVAETPFLGMEHQTIIAYGFQYQRDSRFDYDWLHFHELAHEWWGNLVTVGDWKDFWIHEGIGTYAQALYIESFAGIEGYHREMRRYRFLLSNRAPMAPRESVDGRASYSGLSGNDIYYKGSWVMHTLRYLVGKEKLMGMLRRFTYPSEESESWTDGRQCRTVSSEDFVRHASEWAGTDLSWFFDVYLHEAELPRLKRELREGKLVLEWVVPGDCPFPMPVDVRLGERVVRVPMEGGKGEVAVPEGVEPEVDPERWILRGLGRRGR